MQIKFKETKDASDIYKDAIWILLELLTRNPINVCSVVCSDKQKNDTS